MTVSEKGRQRERRCLGFCLLLISIIHSRLTCAMCKEVGCLSKKFSATLVRVGVGVSVCSSQCLFPIKGCDMVELHTESNAGDCGTKQMLPFCVCVLLRRLS